MKQHFLVLFILFVTCQLSAQSCYDLVWHDEFEYTGAPDPDKWGYDIGGHGWGNNELQYYTNSEKNAYVDNGILEIKAIKESINGNDYSSARLISKGKGDWLYGKIVVRAQLPTGRGTWPAIWMLPTDWEYGGWPKSGEIDIMEHVGYDQGKVHGTVHTDAFNHLKGTQKGGSVNVPKASEDFHEYSIEWDENKIDFFIDGVWYYAFSNTSNGSSEWPFDKRFHLLLNIAVGGSWGGVQGVDPTVFPQSMKVDFVRVYQKSERLKISGNYKVNPNTGGLVYECPYFDEAKYVWELLGPGLIETGQGTNRVEVKVGSENTRLKLSVGNHNCGDSIAFLNIFVDEGTAIPDYGRLKDELQVSVSLSENVVKVSSPNTIDAFRMYDLGGKEIPIRISSFEGAYWITIDRVVPRGLMLLEMTIEGHRVAEKVKL